MPLGIGTLLARYLRMRVGVTNFFFQGRVRASLHPLLNKMPVVGAVKVCSASVLHSAVLRMPRSQSVTYPVLTFLNYSIPQSLMHSLCVRLYL